MRFKIVIFSSLVLFATNSFSQEKKDGIISIQLNSNDSMHIITATVTDAKTKKPIKDVAIVFYLKRTFGLMKVGDEATTDTTGIATAAFPASTPGSNASRTLIIIAKVENNTVINDTAFQILGKAKIAFPTDKVFPRSLMGSRAPWWLIISFWGALGTIYGLFLYIVILIYKIKKSSTRSIIKN